MFFRGEWYEGLYPRAGATPRDLDELRAFEAEMQRWSRWRDGRGRRAFDLPRSRGSDADEVRALDSLSMAASPGRARLEVGAAALARRIRLP